MLSLQQPEDDPRTRAASDRIETTARDAWNDLRSARGWGALVAAMFRHLRPLAHLALYRFHGLLGELNSLLLPPLVALVALEFLGGGLPSAAQVELDAASIAFGACFLAEWAVGLALARNRLAYLANVWLLLDFVSSIPLGNALQAIRLARLARILRLVKLLRLLRVGRRALPLGRVLRALGITTSIAATAALALQALEPEAAPSFNEAMWWAWVTVTTVGYGDITPSQPAGRFLASVLMLVGIGVFSYLAGLMAVTVFDEEEDEILTTVHRIEEQLAVLQSQLDQRPHPRSELSPQRSSEG